MHHLCINNFAGCWRRRRDCGCSGLPQGGDLRLLEDGSESGGALVSDVVASNTASEGQDGNGERVRVSMGPDKKANTVGWRRT